MFALHLGHDMKRRLTFRLRTHPMMNPQQTTPIGLAIGPTFDAIEILGPVRELIAAPGEDEDILCRPQPGVSVDRSHRLGKRQCRDWSV